MHFARKCVHSTPSKKALRAPDNPARTSLQSASYTLELHQPCQRATGDLLCITSKVDLVQSQLATLLPSMKLAFGTLSPTVRLCVRCC